MDRDSSLFIVCGKPGTGKSTYAASLASEKGAVLLELDDLSEPIVRAGLARAGLDPNDRDSADYKQTYRDAVYQAMFDTAKLNLPHLPVVITGPFSRELERADWCDELEQLFDCLVEIHYVYCDENTRRQRIKARANPRDKAKLEAWDSHSAYYTETFPACRHKAICTD